MKAVAYDPRRPNWAGRFAVLTGPATPVRFVPFGGDCRFKEATGLGEYDLNVVLSLLSADVVGCSPCGVKSIEAITGNPVQNRMRQLERQGWAERVGKRGNEVFWRATRRARRELGFVGWQQAEERAAS